MEKRGVGKNAVEIFMRQVEMEKILLPNCAAAVLVRQFHESGGAIEADRLIAHFAKHFQVPARSAAEVQNSERSGTVEDFQERLAVLTDVVIAVAFPKALRVLGVVIERN